MLVQATLPSVQYYVQPYNIANIAIHAHHIRNRETSTFATSDDAYNINLFSSCPRSIQAAFAGNLLESQGDLDKAQTRRA